MHSTNTSAQLSAKSGRPVALHRTQRQEDRRAQRRAFLHHRPAQGAGHRRPPGVALHPCDRHRAERHLRRRGQRPSRFVAPGAAYRPRRNPLGQSRTRPLTRTVRCLVRRRRAGRFGGDLGIIPLQPGFSPETPIIRISGKVGLLSATQSCTFWWQKLFLRIPPCTFFRKKYQKLSDGCLACFRRPNAGNGRLTAGLQANLPRFSRF